MLAFPYYLQWRNEKGEFVSVVDDEGMKNCFDAVDKKESLYFLFLFFFYFFL